jgi:hypothetical protein
MFRSIITEGGGVGWDHRLLSPAGTEGVLLSRLAARTSGVRQ